MRKTEVTLRSYVPVDRKENLFVFASRVFDEDIYLKSYLESTEMTNIEKWYVLYNMLKQIIKELKRIDNIEIPKYTNDTIKKFLKDIYKEDIDAYTSYRTRMNVTDEQKLKILDQLKELKNDLKELGFDMNTYKIADSYAPYFIMLIYKFNQDKISAQTSNKTEDIVQNKGEDEVEQQNIIANRNSLDKSLIEKTIQKLEADVTILFDKIKQLETKQTELSKKVKSNTKRINEMAFRFNKSNNAYTNRIISVGSEENDENKFIQPLSTQDYSTTTMKRIEQLEEEINDIKTKLSDLKAEFDLLQHNIMKLVDMFTT